jgi:hypothetical protein
MARALIVGCGCRGRALGAKLAQGGWAVRGTSRDEPALTEIEGAGIEPAVADPDRPGTILELVGDVAVLWWLLGSARGEPEGVTALHGPRLEALLERLVDTPVRGFVYEAAGTAPRADLDRGAQAVGVAARRWRIPVEVVTTDPSAHEQWLEQMLAASRRLLG